MINTFQKLCLLLPLVFGLSKAFGIKDLTSKQYFYSGELPIENTLELPRLPYKVKLKKGQPIQIVFEDGRIAELRKRAEVKNTEIPMSISESTCTNKATPSSCKFKEELGFISYRLFWSKNPNKEKVNKPLKLAEGTTKIFGKKAEDFNEKTKTYTSFESVKQSPQEKLVLPDSFLNLNKLTLSCNNYSSFGLEDSAKSMNFNEWSLELNTKNPEIFVNQNMVSNAVLDIGFVKSKQGEFQLSHYGYIEGKDDTFFLQFFNSDIVAYNVQKDDFTSCDVSTKLDTSQATQNLTESRINTREKPHSPVIFQSYEHTFWLAKFIHQLPPVQFDEVIKFSLSEELFVSSFLLNALGLFPKLDSVYSTRITINYYDKQSNESDSGAEEYAESKYINVYRLSDYIGYNDEINYSEVIQ